MLHCTEGNSWSVSYKSTPLQVGQIHAQVMGEEPTQADRHAWMDSLERWTCMYTNEQTHKRTTKSGSVSQSSSSAWVIVFTSLLPNWDRHILRSCIYYLQILFMLIDCTDCRNPIHLHSFVAVSVTHHTWTEYWVCVSHSIESATLAGADVIFPPVTYYVDGFHSILHHRNWRAKQFCDAIGKHMVM